MVAASALRTMWCEGKKGRMCPKEQAKAWALREAWRELHGESTYGMCKWIAARVFTVGNPPKHPSIAAVQQFLDKVIEDPEWHPGKIYGKPAGRPCALTGLKKAVIARSAMALKSAGLEPTYPLVLAQCPLAGINPGTGETVGKKRIYDVFEASCYDEDPEEPWRHRARLSKSMLTESDMQKRYAWGKFIKALKLSRAWCARNLIWADICNTIMPRTETKAKLQAQCRKGGKGWMSKGCQMKSRSCVLERKEYGLRSRCGLAPVC